MGSTWLGMAMVNAAEDGTRGNRKKKEEDMSSTNGFPLLPNPRLISKPKGVVFSKKKSLMPLHKEV